MDGIGYTTLPAENQEDGSFPADGNQSTINKVNDKSTTLPAESQEDGSFQADGNQSIINNAKNKSGYHITNGEPGGRLFPSRWPPVYHKQCEQ